MMNERPSGPYTEIREALEQYERLSHAHRWAATRMDGERAKKALAALDSLEREAAERETALETNHALYVRNMNDEYGRRIAAEARVREVEAERDKLNDALREYGRHKYDCRFAREVAALRTADVHVPPINACSCGWDDARAVLVGPEAPAAEPPAAGPREDWYCGCREIAPDRLGTVPVLRPARQDHCALCFTDAPGAAALPAVDAAYVGPVDALADELLTAIREHSPALLDADADMRLVAAYNRLWCELHDKAPAAFRPAADTGAPDE